MAIEKTVYILGAGASASANLPTQAGIIDLVFSLSEKDFYLDDYNIELLKIEMDDYSQKLQSFYSVFDSYRQELGDFISSVFSTKEKHKSYRVALKKAEEMGSIDELLYSKKAEYLDEANQIIRSEKVSLEDLFTIFDSVAANGEHFRKYSPDRMADLHIKLKQCIIYAMSFVINKKGLTTDYQLFSEYLIKERLSVPHKYDNLSVITMNWDDVLEKTVYKLCKEFNSSVKMKQKKILPDMCFYDYDYNNKKGHIPSTHIKAKGNYNIKILKMHGSLAWLECPKCGCLFNDYEREIAYDVFGDVKCPKCKTIGEEEDPSLRSLIITPTFMKSLDNLNIKNIWHNAFIDISEADHIVFIGYSFPDADFEMRCLLKKALKDSAHITVVLSESNDPEYYKKILKNIDGKDIKSIIDKLYLPDRRFSSFFGENRVKYYYKGFKKYIAELGGAP